MLKVRRARSPIVMALAVVAVSLWEASVPSARACPLTPEFTRVVAKVPSADTMILDDGSEVVLIGALPPLNLDTTATAAWPPAEASRKALEALTSGQSVGLAFAGRRRDRYGRHLAHVFLDPDDRHVWVQANLIAAGHARAYALPGHTACFQDLLDHERSARASKAGHWATGIFEDRDAHDPATLTRFRDTFQTIEGRVDHVAKVRGHLVLDFTPGRHGFSVWLPPRTGPHRTHASSPTGQEFAGRRVRVRGWIEARRNPRMTLSSPAEIELLDTPSDSVEHKY